MMNWLRGGGGGGGGGGRTSYTCSASRIKVARTFHTLIVQVIMQNLLSDSFNAKGGD